MSTYIVYFNIGGKNLRMAVDAPSEDAAKQRIYENVKILKVVPPTLNEAQDVREPQARSVKELFPDFSNKDWKDINTALKDLFGR